MPNVRAINSKKYDISKHRFAELYHFCLQYNEWKEQLKIYRDTLKSPRITGMPVQHGTADLTAELAVQRSLLTDKCSIVEETAREIDDEIFPYLLKAVTNEGITYNYLALVCGMPCGKDRYYDRRRKFYCLLSQKMENRNHGTK
ncbi:hypothetical protein [Anaerolentibacter hominis]|uniref:hypothetical protein n=1 Tax=Anaerolentibacter hominis TaxID=3079009 RepID=UPI0031B87ABC